MSIRNGYGAPAARVFNASGTEVFERVVAFNYMHSEKMDDSSRIVIETGDVSLVDHPDLQEGKKIKVVFGYLSNDRTRSHILYIWDVTAHFGDNYIRIEIVAYCKAAYMKLNSSKETYNNTDLKSVADAMGKKYGLNVKDETTEEKKTEQSVVDYNGKTNSVLTFSAETDAGGKAYVTAARDNTALPIRHFIPKTHTAVPQAGASDATQIDKMIDIEPFGENLVVEGRDDDLIIKRRNLLQKPFMAFTYRSDPAHLLEFTPAVRNREYRKAAVGSSVGGWDENLGKYFQGSIDGANSSVPMLGDSTEIMEYPKGELDGHSTQPYSSPSDNGQEVSKEINKEKLENGKEWQNVLYYGVQARPEILDFNIKNLKTLTPVDETALTFRMPIPPKENVPTVETSPKDAAGVGINRQVKKEQEIHECTARVIGDPDLQSGKIITIMNVGKKFSGNYYIVSAEHTIGPSGYITNLVIFRNGKKKLTEEEAIVNGGYIGRKVNAQQALPNDGTIQLNQIPIRKD